MNSEEFNIEVENSHLRSKKVLIKKASEYARGEDRLEQFHRAGCAQNIICTEALIGMATKHYTSISDMAKNPLAYTLRQWNGKVTDLRNYTYLLDALVRDIGAE